MNTSPENEISIVAVVQAKPGHADAVHDILRAVVEPSRAEPGCRAYQLFRDRSDPGRFVFIERWRDPAAIALHEASPHFRALGPALAEHVEPQGGVMKLDRLC